MRVLKALGVKRKALHPAVFDEYFAHIVVIFLAESCDYAVKGGLDLVKGGGSADSESFWRLGGVGYRKS